MCRASLKFVYASDVVNLSRRISSRVARYVRYAGFLGRFFRTALIKRVVICNLIRLVYVYCAHTG